MARPIIGSVAGEPAEILKKSKGAVVVEPEDSQAIADAALFLYQDPEVCRKLGDAGRRFVRAHYSRAALARRYLNVLEEAIYTFRRN